MTSNKNLYILLIVLNRILGLCLFSWGVIFFLSLISFDYGDPSFNSASTSFEIHNFLGSFGSHLADLFYQLIGLSSYVLCLIFVNFGARMGLYGSIRYLLFKIALTPICILSFSAFLTILTTPDIWPFESLGGVNGMFIVEALLIMQFPLINQTVIMIGSLLLFFVSLSWIINISWQDWSYFYRYSWQIFKFFLSRIFGPVTSGIKSKFSIGITIKKTPKDEAKIADNSALPQVDDVKFDVVIKESKEESRESLKKRLKASISRSKTAVGGLSTSYQLPHIDLLVDRSSENKDKVISKTVVEAQSQNLLKVLEDFGVYGKMIGAQLGPVVTLHEFEPAAGTKASRIIGLADDIARSMSAVSARIAVISGKTSIGVELPNPKRQMIFLKELAESKKYQLSDFYLPMILGKNIGGELVIADLAKMPHLLIAGTTGSGKSVGLNVMILSLLYRLRPDECKFIMIDPKMLELSIYNGIPHLLSPVVTEPAKAVVALKWVVAEMEERYRLMSSFAVRNIAGYNEKAEKAALNGEQLTRKVQTGFDPTNGQPIIEEISFEPKKIPFIVVIVDEMADLMLVAGKEIESSVQRLAQMARAAGIHIIMATQRPSVDVITGVIKANFPTRISFQVTSRIDSRTILGVQGAEQLLGQGDMIYMSGGSKMIRAHGPFCSDKEIEEIVNFIKSQRVDEEEGADKISFDSEDVLAGKGNQNQPSSANESVKVSADADLYTQAVAIVRRDNKASISYVQRQLRIGYNRAATLIEKMEEQGVVTAPSVSGKREVIAADS